MWHLSLTQGGVTINSNYEILVECIVKPWPGHQGPLLHRFDSGDFVTRGQFRSSPASVGICARVCVCMYINHELVHTIIHHSFKLGSPNWDLVCKIPRLRCLLFSGMIDHDIQGQI